MISKFLYLKHRILFLCFVFSLFYDLFIPYMNYWLMLNKVLLILLFMYYLRLYVLDFVLFKRRL